MCMFTYLYSAQYCNILAIHVSPTCWHRISNESSVQTLAVSVQRQTGSAGMDGRQRDGSWHASPLTADIRLVEGKAWGAIPMADSRS